MRQEILFLSHRIPFPPNRGDKIRSNHILRRLACIAPVHVACFADDEADLAEEVELAGVAHSYRLVRRTKALVMAGIEAIARRRPVSLTAFHSPALAQYVDKLCASGRIGTIYVFSGQMGQYVPADFAGRLVVDFVDVDSAKFEAYAAQQGDLFGWVNAREARLLRAEESRLARRADVSLLVSAEEAALMASRVGEQVAASADIRALVNGIDAVFFDPATVAAEPAMLAMPGPRLIFTGQMDYPPNVAAALRVADRILPAVREHLPDASFHVVGRNPTAELVARHGRDGIHVWGRVEDIRGWIKASDIALIPLEIARGIQNKVLEAMAMEVPVVLSREAATGIDAVDGHHFRIAETDAELAAALIETASDPRGAKAMAVAARHCVVERQSWQGTLAPLAEIVTGPPRLERDAA